MGFGKLPVQIFVRQASNLKQSKDLMFNKCKVKRKNHSLLNSH